MKKLIYFLNILLVIAVAGCSKDFLEVEPVGQLTSENFLKNDNDVKLATMGIYNKIQQNYSAGAWASVHFIKNLPDDPRIIPRPVKTVADEQGLCLFHR